MGDPSLSRFSPECACCASNARIIEARRRRLFPLRRLRVTHTTRIAATMAINPAKDPAIMATGDGMWCVDGSESDASVESVELEDGAEEVELLEAVE